MTDNWWLITDNWELTTDAHHDDHDDDDKFSDPNSVVVLDFVWVNVLLHKPGSPCKMSSHFWRISLLNLLGENEWSNLKITPVDGSPMRPSSDVYKTLTSYQTLETQYKILPWMHIKPIVKIIG